MTTELTPKQLYRREYYQKNKDKAKTQIRARYEAKKEELLEYQKKYRQEHRERIKIRERHKKRQAKLDAIEYLGGKCSACFGIFPPIVYDFHHKNPEEKEFILSEHWSGNKERLYSELDKCVLLCANCHRLEHLEKYD